MPPPAPSLAAAEEAAAAPVVKEVVEAQAADAWHQPLQTQSRRHCCSGRRTLTQRRSRQRLLLSRCKLFAAHTPAVPSHRQASVHDPYMDEA